MSQSEVFGPASAVTGLTFYSYGTDLVITNPRANLRWSFYMGPITREGGPDTSLRNLLAQSAIDFNSLPHDTAPGSIQNVKGSAVINNLNHAVAVRAEVERID